MRKATKVGLIVTVSLASVGVIVTIAGLVLGGVNNRLEDFLGVNHYISNEVEYTPEYDEEFDDWQYDEYENSSYTGGDPYQAVKGYKKSSEFQNVDTVQIEVGSTQLEVYRYEGNKILFGSNLEGKDELNVEQEGSNLKIKSKNKELIKNRNERKIKTILFLPNQTQLKKLDIELGAGTLFLGEGEVEELSIELGAGSVSNTGIFKAKEIKLQTGTGEIELYEMISDSLSLSCGVGDVVFSGDVLKKGVIDCGTGSVELYLDRAEKDYNYSADAGMGDISLNDDSISTFDTKKIDNGGTTDLDLSVGIGDIEIHSVN